MGLHRERQHRASPLRLSALGSSRPQRPPVPGGPWRPAATPGKPFLCGGSRPKRVPRESPRREDHGVSPPPGACLFPSSTGRPRRWRSGKRGGNAGFAGGRAGAGSWGNPSAKGRRVRAKETPRVRAGGRTRGHHSFSSAGSRGISSRGTPTQRLPTWRTKGLGSSAGVGGRRWREAGRQAVGAGEGACPHFLSRPCDGKLYPANAFLRRPLLNPGELGFLT